MPARNYLLIVLCLIAWQISFGQKYSNEFLAIGVSAKAHGMGTAMVSHTGDINSNYWNPAGLTRINAPFQLGAMHAEWFAGIAQYDYLGAAKPLDESRGSVFGAYLIRLGIDQIPNTLNLIEPDGTVNYDNVTEFSAADYALGLTYAQKLKNPNWSVGGSVKIIHRSIGDFGNAWGFGLDGGIQYSSGQWNVGLLARDVTSTFNAWSFSLSEEEKEVFTQTGNEIPENSTEITKPSFILGASRMHALGENFSLLAALDLVWTTDGERNVLIHSEAINIDPRLGFELGYKEKVYIRTGLNNVQRIPNDPGKDGDKLNAQANFGVGLSLGQLNIDYALTDIGNVSETLYSHIFSLIYSFKIRE